MQLGLYAKFYNSPCMCMSLCVLLWEERHFTELYFSDAALFSLRHTFIWTP